MPIAASKRQRGRLAPFLDFSLIPVIGIACFRLSPLAFNLAGQDASLAFIARMMQTIILILVLIIDRRIPYKENNLLTVLGVAVVITTVSTVLFIVAPSETLRLIGRSLNGAASAVILLSWGYYLCSIDPKKMVFSISLGFALYGFTAWTLTGIDFPTAAFLTFALPLVSYACLRTSILHLGPKATGDAPLTKAVMTSIPWSIIALMAVCTVSSILSKLLIHPANSEGSSWFALLRFLFYLGIFCLYYIWMFILKRDDQDRLWPIYVLVIFCGLIYYVSFSALQPDIASGVLRATQDCLMLFCWIMAAGMISSRNLPRIFLFGLAILVFVESPLFIASLFSFLFSAAGVAHVDLLTLAVPAVIITALTILTVILICSNSSIEAHSVEKVTAAESGLSALSAAVENLASRFELTKREAEIMLYLARGYTLSQTAETLCLSINTIRSHATSLYRKLGIHKKRQLIAAIEESMQSAESD